MLVLFIISFFAIIFTYLEGKGKLRQGMLLGFILIVAVTSIRYDYGNDYWSYFDKFQLISRLSFSSLFREYLGTEIGWLLLNYLFRNLGFYWFLAALSLINGFVYYSLIKEYVDVDKRWFAVFVYLFSDAFFSVQLSMLRQALAMGLIILAIISIERKNNVLAIILGLLAISFHTSAVFALPVFLIYLLPFRNGQVSVLLLIGFSVVFFFFGEVVLRWSFMLLDSSDIFERYEEKYILGNEYSTAGIKNAVGLILLLFPVAVQVLLIWDNRVNERLRKLCLVSVFGTIVSFMAQRIPMAGRVSWYYTVFSIVSIPQSFYFIKEKFLRNALIVLFVIVIVKDYIGFYTSETWRDMHYTFHTLFER